MNTSIQKYSEPTKSLFSEQNRASGYKLNHDFKELSVISRGSSSSPVDDESSPEGNLFSSPTKSNGSSPVDGSSSEGESFTDHSDAMLKFISQMLMEEGDLENKPCMLHDCLALQATEKSLYDVLKNNLDEKIKNPSENFSQISSTVSSERSPDVTSFLDLSGDFESVPFSLPTFESDFQPFGSSDGTIHGVYSHNDSPRNPFWVSDSSTESQEIAQFLFNIDAEEVMGENEMIFSPNNSREKKIHGREGRDFVEDHRSNKQLANNVDESEPLDMYDKVLLCSKLEPLTPPCDESHQIDRLLKNDQSKRSYKARSKGVKKQAPLKEVVDLRSLLVQCAQAVSIYDRRTVTDLLNRIRQHSSPQGDGTERLAHYFANALESRLAGTGTELYAALSSRRTSAAEILKAYKAFITACPFKKMSNLFANKTIRKLSNGANKLHIIDFGILYGFQWPCLIQTLSERPGGPLSLKITGIDFPQPGFRPAERVKDTGRRLAKYCERFNVPFEYTAIAQKWETIKIEDVNLKRDELLIVNSLYRLQNVPDETVIANSPRDAVLDLIRRIDPDLFIHGVVNGTYNTPFFVTRFREALFHFSSMFDMFEASLPREDLQRALFEEAVFGKEAMNVIACEGTERVERPETYKQWGGRHVRAGFRQVALDGEIVRHVRGKVRREYQKDFSVDEDGKWMLQGWRGRVIHGLSCWKPAHK